MGSGSPGILKKERRRGGGGVAGNGRQAAGSQEGRTSDSKEGRKFPRLARSARFWRDMFWRDMEIIAAVSAGICQKDRKPAGKCDKIAAYSEEKKNGRTRVHGADYDSCSG